MCNDKNIYHYTLASRGDLHSISKLYTPIWPRCSKFPIKEVFMKDLTIFQLENFKRPIKQEEDFLKHKTPFPFRV